MQGDPLEVIEALGLPHRAVNWRGEIAFCCHEHEDRHPSATMRADDGRWICHACGARGNLLTMLRSLGREDLIGHLREDLQGHGGRPYERLTTRTPGSNDSILEMARYADFMLRDGYPHADVERALRDGFEVSARTASECVAWLTGRRCVRLDPNGRARGTRWAYVVGKVRKSSKEFKLAVKAERGYWSGRRTLLRTYLVVSEVAEEKYAGRASGTAIWTAEMLVAEDLIPRPPPGVGHWTTFETVILVQEVIERRRRGVSLLAPWDVAPEPVAEDDGPDEFEYATFSAPTSGLLLAA